MSSSCCVAGRLFFPCSGLIVRTGHSAVKLEARSRGFVPESGQLLMEPPAFSVADCFGPNPGWIGAVTRLLLAEIRRRFVTEARPLDAATEAALKADSRPGAKAILDAIARRRAENRSEGQRLRKLLQFESALWD